MWSKRGENQNTVTNNFKTYISSTMMYFICIYVYLTAFCKKMSAFKWMICICIFFHLLTVLSSEILSFLFFMSNIVQSWTSNEIWHLFDTIYGLLSNILSYYTQNTKYLKYETFMKNILFLLLEKESFRF